MPTDRESTSDLETTFVSRFSFLLTRMLINVQQYTSSTYSTILSEESYQANLLCVRRDDKRSSEVAS